MICCFMLAEAVFQAIAGYTNSATQKLHYIYIQCIYSIPIYHWKHCRGKYTVAIQIKGDTI